MFNNGDVYQYLSSISDTEDEVLIKLSRETHLKVYHPRMLSEHLQGKLLNFICAMIKPKNILEIGTYTGYSAISMAKAIGENSKITTIEINDELEDIIRKYFKLAQVETKIDLIIADAIDVLPSLNLNFDLAFIDGDKSKYLDYYKIVIEKIKPGGFIIADNILWSGKIFDKNIKNNDYFTKGIIEFNNFIAKDNRIEKVALPLRDGLLLMRKKTAIDI